MERMITVTEDFARQALWYRYDEVKDLWSDSIINSHINEIFDYILEPGYIAKDNVMAAIDNLLINGDYGYLNKYAEPGESREETINRLKEERDYIFLLLDDNDPSNDYVVFSLG
jgi:hypothetical protein